MHLYRIFKAAKPVYKLFKKQERTPKEEQLVASYKKTFKYIAIMLGVLIVMMLVMSFMVYTNS